MTLIRRGWTIPVLLLVGGSLGPGDRAYGSEAVADALSGASLVLVGGRVVTMDDAAPEAEAIALQGNRILAVGDEASIRALVRHGVTRVIELEGRMVMPGFIEGHGHFIGLGESRMNLDLSRVRNWQEVVQMVAEAAQHTPPGEWIVGRGWHQEKWDRSPGEMVEGFPVHDAVSKVSPEHPVLLVHASGHLSFANRHAMEVSGISATTEDPPGGEILRNLAGDPIGIFRQNAQRLVRGREQPMTPRARFERMDRAIDLAIDACVQHGVTSFHDAGLTFPEIDRLVERAEAGTLGVRLWIMMRTSIDEMERHAGRYARFRRVGDDRLTVGGIKFAIDGALGSRGAWLLEPYTDSPESPGFHTTPIEVLERAAHLAMAHDLQLCIHAIGDRANRETLDLYERIFRGSANSLGISEEDALRAGAKRRWRIEHAQHLHPEDIPRFAHIGVIAAMQGVHCTSDGPWVPARLGEERSRTGAYAWRSLLDAGAIVINGTDAPVEPIDPIASFHASVTRLLPDGTRFFPEQRMTRSEALRSYTTDAAYAVFEEDLKGVLKPGLLADIVVLSGDILHLPEELLPGVRVDYTIIGGEVVWERER